MAPFTPTNRINSEIVKSPRRAPVTAVFALLLAMVSGVLMNAGFPELNWWPLTFLGIGLLLLALMGRRSGSALLIGLVAGLTFYLTYVSWTSLYLGDLPWIALSTLESLFVMVGSLAIALAYRWVPSVWPSRWGRIGLLPVVIAGLWTAREALSNTWPYGGFAWGRVAISQSQTPFSHLVSWVGISGLSFLMVWIVAVILACIFEPKMRISSRFSLSFGAVALVLVVPFWSATTSGTVRVGAVQGNGPAGYFQASQPGDVMMAQVSATVPLFRKDLDMVVWPEGAADIDPTRYADSADLLNYVTQRTGAPLITGTVTYRHGKYYNTSLLWKTGRGAVDFYDKAHPVPFGEYVPDRSFWEPFAPDLIGLIQRDYTPGVRSNVFDINGVRAGVSICFDIVDDHLITEMMDGGAQLILAQTNNADFGQTKENVQQLAIARLRAIESARSLVNISTVGTSQVIDPNGRTITSIPAYKPGAMVAEVPLGTTTTPAVILSRDIELFVSGLGLAGLVLGGITIFTRRSRG